MDMLSSNHHIRPAIDTDISIIATLFRESWRENLAFLPVLHTPEEDQAFLRRYLTAPDTEFWVLKAENKIQGFLVHQKGWLHQLYIHPEGQGKGYGGALLKRIQAQSDSLRLWTFQKNTAAQTFYQKYGFRILKATEGEGNEEKEPDYLMGWERDSQQI